MTYDNTDTNADGTIDSDINTNSLKIGDDWEQRYDANNNRLLIEYTPNGNQFELNEDGTLKPLDGDIDLGGVNSITNASSVSTDNLNSSTEFVEPGESIQSAIDSVSASGGGAVVLEPGTHTESGITIPFTVELRGYDYRSTTLKAEADENVVTLNGGQSRVSNLKIDTETVAGFSSAAVYHSGGIDRYHEAIKGVFLNGSAGSTDGDAMIRLDASGGDSIAWLLASDCLLSGGNYGIHAKSDDPSSYVNGCAFENIQFQSNTFPLYEELVSGEISGNSYEIGGNGNSDITSFARIEGTNGMVKVRAFESGLTSAAPVELTASAVDNDVHLPIGITAGAVSDSGSNNLIDSGYDWLEFGTEGSVPGAAASSDDTWADFNQAQTSVTFDSEFNSSPTVLVSRENFRGEFAYPSGVTTTGFTINVANYSSTDRSGTNRAVHWIAVDQY